MNVEEIVVAIEKLNVVELVELKKALEARWGVTAAAPMVAAAATSAASAAPAAGPAAEEQTEFEIVLKEIGPEKIKVIKAVRELTNLGLKESKELVDGAPSSVKKGVNKEEAAAAKAKLEEAGAVVEVK
jgi:large subunit ribosomal protein L7/L12